MSDVVIQSVDGPRLTLSRFGEQSDGWYSFHAVVEAPDLHASCVVHDRWYVGDPSSPTSALADLVRETATEYRGWDGVKTWVATEHQLSVEATSDRTGHATFRFRLREDALDGWRAEATVVLDVMQRERWARELRQFFSAPKTE